MQWQLIFFKQCWTLQFYLEKLLKIVSSHWILLSNPKLFPTYHLGKKKNKSFFWLFVHFVRGFVTKFFPFEFIFSLTRQKTIFWEPSSSDY